MTSAAVSRFVQIGLVLAVWFGVFARAGHDLWSSCVLFGLLTLLVLVFLAGQARFPRPFRIPFYPQALALIAYTALSPFFSYDFAASRHEAWIVFFCMVAFYLMINTTDSKMDMQRFFWRCSLVLLPLAAVCLYDQFTGHPEGYGQIRIFSQIIRYGHWEIPGSLISSIVLSSFVLTWFFFLWESRSTSPLSILLGMAFMLILMLARSWWAIISLGVGFTYYKGDALVGLYRRRKRLFMGIGALVFMALALVAYAKLGGHQTAHYSSSNRLDWWMAAVQMWKAHPWTGVGLGAFQVAYPFFRVEHGHGTLYAHSSLLQMVAETGIIGLILMAWWGILWFQSVRRSLPHIQNARPSSRALVATLITVLVYSSINITTEYFLTKMIVVFLGGLLVCFDKNIFTKSVPRLWLAPVAVAFVTFLPYWMSPWQASRIALNAYASENQGDMAHAQKQWAHALDLDPRNGDYHAAMARLYQRSFQENKIEDHKTHWRYHALEAARWKKSVRNLKDVRVQ